jgi:hypothetical protein
MPEPESLESVADALHDALQLCIENGLAQPFTPAVISRNGSALIVRTDGEDSQVLAKHVQNMKPSSAPIYPSPRFLGPLARRS